MLIYLSIPLAALTLAVLAVSPRKGIPLLFLARPVIDTAWDSVFLGIRLTHVVGAAVPVIILFHSYFGPKEERLSRLPLVWVWAPYLILNFLSGLFIFYNDLYGGAEVFFRLLNGFVGYYMLQRYFRTEEEFEKLLKILILAGIFPIGIGVYQLISGHVWTPWDSEGLQRNIGLYHDQATLKYFWFQTLTAIMLYWSYFVKGSRAQMIALASYFAVSLPVLYKLYVKSGNLALGLWVVGWSILKRKFHILVAASVVILTLNFAMGNKLFSELFTVYHKEIGVFQKSSFTIQDTFAGRWYDWEVLMDDWNRKTSILEKAFGSGMSYLGAHNDYLFAILRSGLVGLGLYLLLLAVFGLRLLIDGLNRASPLRVMALLIFMLWMIETIGLVPSAYPAFQWYAWGFIGLSVRCDASFCESVPEKAQSV